jgi:hypothetical protein
MMEIKSVVVKVILTGDKYYKLYYKYYKYLTNRQGHPRSCWQKWFLGQQQKRKRVKELSQNLWRFLSEKTVIISNGLYSRCQVA